MESSDLFDTTAASSSDSGITVPGVTVLGPTVAVTVSEVLLFVGRIDLALWAHLLTLLGLAAALGVGGERVDRPVLVAFALLPLFRLVNLGMPVFVELTVLWLPVIYAPFLPVLYHVVRESEHASTTTRPRRAALLLVPAVLLGAVLASVEYAILRPEGLVTALDPLSILLVAVVMIGFVGLVEELLFRAVLQRRLQACVGRWPGLLVASGLFGLMHAGYGLSIEIAFAGAAGLLFGLLYDATDSLATVTIAHGTLNVFLFAVIPLGGPAVPIPPLPIG
jgi:hypothetical protein